MTVCTSVAANVTHAQESPWTSSAIEFRVGAFLGDFTTDVILTGPRGGSEINLEDDLGLDADQTTFRGELHWRFADRHRLGLAFYEFDRTAIGDAQRFFTTDTEDQTLEFDVGVAVRSELTGG